MVDDGLYDSARHACPIPDMVLSQHVVPFAAGTVIPKPGSVMSAADSLKITIYGIGGHGSLPLTCIDPVVIASYLVVRLQGIVIRVVAPNETAVVTVGSLQAGQKENVIGDEVVLKLNIRAFTTEVRDKVLSATRRIVKAECLAGNCPKDPLIEVISAAPLTERRKGQLRDTHFLRHTFWEGPHHEHTRDRAAE